MAAGFRAFRLLSEWSGGYTVNKAVYADQGETKAGVDDRRFYITLMVTVSQWGIRRSVGLDKLYKYPQHIKAD